MSHLLKKEWRAARPFLLLVLVFGFFTAADTLLLKAPDTTSLAAMVNDRDDDAEGGITAFVYLLLAFAMAGGVLVREQDEGTLEFLDSLPCSRTRLFVAKLGVSFAVLGILPLLDTTTAAVAHTLGRTSLDRSLHVPLLVGTALIEWLMLMVYFSLGLVLSFLRRFSFLALALLFAGFLWVRQWPVPWIDRLNLLAVTDYEFHGPRLLVPWASLGVMAALMVACLVGAWGLFLRQGAMGRFRETWWQRGRLKGALVAVGTALMVVAWVGLFWWMMRGEIDKDEERGVHTTAEGARVAYGSWAISRTEAGGFTFVYPEDLSARAGLLTSQAGEVHEKVRSFFGAEAASPLVADLHSPLRHAAGTANWKRVNLNVARESDPAELAAILGHETTHVYIDVLSDGALRRNFASTRWFHEGLATFVEYELFHPPEKRSRLRRLAAFAQARGEAGLDTMADDAVWRREMDPNAVYPLGELFVAALVDRYGRDAPVALLRAAAREEAPDDLAGVAFWSDLFQAAGYDFAAVAEEYHHRLDRLEEETEAAFLATLPRLAVSVAREGAWIRFVVEPTAPLPAGVEVMGRVRSDVDADESRFVELTELEDGHWYVEASAVPGRVVWYQFGFHWPDAPLPAYERWTRATVR